MGKRLRLHIPTIIAVLFTIGILIGSFVWFSRHTNEMVASTTKFYLETNARSQAAAFNTKLMSQLELLRLQSEHLARGNLDSDESVRQRMMRLGAVEGFSRLAMAGRSGRLFDTAGRDLGDISKTGYFERAMQGQTTIADSILSDANEEEYLYMAVPITQEAASAGVLYGQFTLSVLSNLIEAVGFQETSTSLLLASDGTILARSSDSELVTNRIANFYDLGSSWGIDGESSLLDIKLDVAAGKTITVPYQTGSRERLAILTPVGLNNWYYAIVISQDVIHRQSDTLSYNLLFVEAIITLAFICLFITILQLMHHTALVERTNDRFKIATTQAHTIVFDYNCLDQRLDVNGSVEFLDEESKGSYDHAELAKKAKEILHESDNSLIADLKALDHNEETSLHREIRLRCVDGNYYWYRLTGTVVRGEDGKLLRLVGNLMNVEDEIGKREQLKQKAETDPLSGLLNKGAFTGYVSNLLAKSSPEKNLYAFYIIDLDNFKKVNDTLGHIVGDRVITDVAKKLCTVFSENDYIGRIGGDEFTAFLRLSGEGVQIGRKIIHTKAEAVRAIVDEIYSDGKNDVNITSSIGVALYPKDGSTFAELYKNADKALYISKNNGKNQYNLCP